MPLSLVVFPAANANSYVSVEDALASAAYRIGGSAFVDDLESDQHVQALATAYDALNAVQWNATVQALLDAGEAPGWLIRAQIELAISYTPRFADNADALNPDTTSVEAIDVGPVEIKFGKDKRTVDAIEQSIAHFPLHVRQLIGPYVFARAASTWGMSTATRVA